MEIVALPFQVVARRIAQAQAVARVRSLLPAVPAMSDQDLIDLVAAADDVGPGGEEVLEAASRELCDRLAVYEMEEVVAREEAVASEADDDAGPVFIG